MKQAKRQRRMLTPLWTSPPRARHWTTVAALLLGLLLAAALAQPTTLFAGQGTPLIRQSEAESDEPLVFTPSLSGVEEIVAMRGPAIGFADYLAESSGLTVTAFVPTDYGATLQGLRQGSYDIVYLPSYLYVKANAETGATAAYAVSIDGSATVTGVIVVAADSDITSLAGLEGKTVGAADLESGATWIMPAAAVKEAGLNPLVDLDLYFTGTYTENVVAVVNGELDAAFVTESTLTDASLLAAAPDVAEQIQVLEEFPNVPTGVIAFRAGLDEAQQAALMDALGDEAALTAAVDADGNSVLEGLGWDGLVPLDEIDFDALTDAAVVMGLIKQAPAATGMPEEEPTVQATEEPTEEPTEEATEEPTAEPIEESTAEPTEEPTPEATEEAVEEATPAATEEATEEATAEPTEEATEEPAEEATPVPTEEAMEEATPAATEEPAEEPTEEPTEEPAEEAAAEQDSFVITPPLAGVDAMVATRGPTTALADYLAEASGLAVTAFVPTDYGATLQGLRRGSYDLVYLPSPLFARANVELDAQPGFLVSANGVTTETGVIVVAADSGISDLGGLADKTVGASDIESAAGWVMPAAALKEAGINPLSDIDLYFTGTYTENLLAVVNGELDAAFVTAGALEDANVLAIAPDVADQVTILAEFPDVPIGVIAFRAGLDEADQAALAEALAAADLSAITDADGNTLAAAFGWDGLVPAEPEDFAAVIEAATTLGMIRTAQ